MNTAMRAGALALALASIGIMGAAPAAATTTFGGYGYGAKIDTSITGNHLFGWSGNLPSGGGARAKSVLEANILGALNSRILHGSVNGSHGKVHALGSVARINLFPATLYGLQCELATSEALLSATGHTGRSTIVNLHFGGKAIDITGHYNQVVEIPGIAKLVINEKIFLANGPSRRLRMNALRLHIYGLGSVVMGASEANMNWTTNDNGPCFDFLCGCGRFFDLITGCRVDFSVNVGIDHNKAVFIVNGNILCSDLDLKVVLKTCSAYKLIHKGRKILGKCAINGIDGYDYILECWDYSSDGSIDKFKIWLSNGQILEGTCAPGQIRLNLPCGTLALP